MKKYGRIFLPYLNKYKWLNTNFVVRNIQGIYRQVGRIDWIPPFTRLHTQQNAYFTNKRWKIYSYVCRYVKFGMNTKFSRVSTYQIVIKIGVSLGKFNKANMVDRRVAPVTDNPLRDECLDTESMQWIYHINRHLRVRVRA